MVEKRKINTVKELSDLLISLVKRNKGDYDLYVDGTAWDTINVTIDDDVSVVDLDGEYTNWN